MLRRALSDPRAFVLFLLLMVWAWVFANPPGYVHDEPAHYTKALGVGRGQWAGRPGRYPVGPGFGPEQLKWINKAARVVDIPPHMAPDGFACSIFDPPKSAQCLHALRPPAEAVTRLTYVGSYEPFLYLPPGLAMARSHDALTALRLGRTVSAAISIILLGLAVVALAHPGDGGFSLLGLVAATTPMVVYLMSGLSPAGPEVAAQLCFASALIRLARPRPPTGLVWVAAAAGGAVLAMSRSLGPFFLAFDVGLLVVAMGPGRAWAAVRGGGRAAAVAVSAVVLGVGANAAWGLTVQAHPPHQVSRVLAAVGQSVREVPEVLRQDVGSFGWADVNMPRAAYGAWGLLGASVVGLALVIGRRRERLAVITVLAGAFTGTVAIAAAVIHQTHFPMYGRYALPLWVAVPLVAGEVVFRNRSRLGVAAQRTTVVAATVVAGAVHLTGFYSMARQYAVGAFGPVLFMGRSLWAPPYHWVTWLVVVGVAVAALVAYGLTSSRPVPDP